jgi:phage shock protein A
MYIARARSAKASEKLNEMMGRIGTGSALSAFEKMEEKVLQMEARSEAIAELNSGDAIEQQFKELESGDRGIDEELAAMKAQFAAGRSPSLPSVDVELEQLRAKLEGR